MRLLVFILIFSWLFSGWPQIWQNPPIPPEIQKVYAAADGAMMVYALGTDTTPRYRIWNESTDTLGAEGSATAVSGTIQFMVLRFARTRDEAILGTLDSTGDIRTQVWNGSTWSATTLHANVGTTNDIYRGFDIAYETSGNRAIIVYNNANSADPSYKIWNGASWSGATAITDPATTGAPFWIELAANPLSASNEIAMMFIDANVDVYGMVWTGSAWSQMGAGTAAWDDTGAIATKESIDVAYEQNSGRAMFIWADSVATDQYYRIWNGTTLTSATLLDIAASGGIGEWVRLVPRPNSNELMYGVQDAGVDLNTRKWDGTSAWDTATQHPEHDASVEQITTRNFDIAWETYSANAGKAWLLYCDSATVSHKQWSGTAWGTATTNGDDTAWIRLEAQPTSGTFFGMIFQDSSSGNDDILEEHLVDGGTTWSALFTVWAGAVVEVTYEPFDIAMMRYAPNEPPTLSISQPDGVSDTVTVGDPYNITYTLSDPDNVVTAAFYYDTNNTGLDGTAISGPCATAAEGSGVTCSWNTTGMTPGNYYVYGITNDGVNPQVSAYSSGQITINAAGTLTVDIVDASYVSVGSPTMAMNTATFSFTCQTVTGSFGIASQQIYVNNNNGANNGWALTVAAQATTNVWDSAGTDYDFNDPTGSGCTDGADAGDSVGGQMTVDPSVATLAVGQCGSCTTNNISKGSSAAFNQGTTDSITLLTATAASDDVGDWKLTGVSISQKIPAEQPAASDYDINMVLTVTAN